MRTLAALLFLPLCAVGCAHARAPHPTLPRERLGYTDHKLFALMHYDAYPAEIGPSAGVRDYGGRVTGRVCGADVNLEAEYRGRYLALTGHVYPLEVTSTIVDDSEYASRIEVRDHAERGGVVDRRISGTVGATGRDLADALNFGRPPRRAIDLELTRDRLRGHVGLRDLDLRAHDDTLEGTMTIAEQKLPFRIRGWGAVWSMPAADQAAILPFVLTCVADGTHLIQDLAFN